MRALQNTVEFETGAVFTTEHSDRLDRLIKDGRLAVVEDDAESAEYVTPSALVGSYTQADVDTAAAASSEAQNDLANARLDAEVHVGELAAELDSERSDTPPAATESDAKEPAPERPKNARAAKPKTDTK
ncbi:hypothetical protein BJF84_21295 [Rhodococcus sp. CUA-806]|nr:hypothetical protein BJF84_21295 [Rhodococcus sp. CUA-806]